METQDTKIQTHIWVDETSDLCDAIATAQLAVDGMDGSEYRAPLAWLLERVQQAADALHQRAVRMHEGEA